MRFSVLVTLASLSLCEPGQQTQTSGLPGDSGVAPSAPTPALTTPFEPQTRNAIGGDGVSSSQAKKAVSDNQNSAEHVDGATTQQTVAPREPNERVSENGSEPHFTTMNEVILDVLVGMPKGGGYDSSPDGMSTRNLGSAIRIESNRLIIDPEKAKPSFCSSATYLVFLLALDRLNRAGHLDISPKAMQKLLVHGQGDGVGVWGRWNANGPGTARLFEELQLGHNFTALEEARAGDFMKIFWSDQIGSKESGHSVIYLGRGSPAENGEDTIVIWSSNIPDGYGRKEIPVSKVKRAVFSRLEDPRKIEGVLQLPDRDSYLAALEKRPGTLDEMLRKINIPTPGMIKKDEQTPSAQLPKTDSSHKEGTTATRPDLGPSGDQDRRVEEDTHNSKPTPSPSNGVQSMVSPAPAQDHR